MAAQIAHTKHIEVALGISFNLGTHEPPEASGDSKAMGLAQWLLNLRILYNCYSTIGVRKVATSAKLFYSDVISPDIPIDIHQVSVARKCSPVPVRVRASNFFFPDLMQMCYITVMNERHVLSLVLNEHKTQSRDNLHCVCGNVFLRRQVSGLGGW